MSTLREQVCTALGLPSGASDEAIHGGALALAARRGKTVAMAKPARVYANLPPSGEDVKLIHHPRGSDYGYALEDSHGYIIAADTSDTVLKQWAVSKGYDVS